MNALERKGVQHSVSPINYDNGLGYAPRTIRLFNQGSKGRKSPSKSRNVKIGDKTMDKDNIFVSLVAEKKLGPLNPTTLLNSSPERYPPAKAVIDYTQGKFTEEDTKKLMLNHNSTSSRISLHRNLLGKTDTPSMISLNNSSRASLHNSPTARKQFDFKIVNNKDWAPKEIASRSQVYAPPISSGEDSG